MARQDNLSSKTDSKVFNVRMLLLSLNSPSHSKKQCDAFDFGRTHIVLNIKATKNLILNKENIQYSLKTNVQHLKFQKPQTPKEGVHTKITSISVKSELWILEYTI